MRKGNIINPPLVQFFSNTFILEELTNYIWNGKGQCFGYFPEIFRKCGSLN